MRMTRAVYGLGLLGLAAGLVVGGCSREEGEVVEEGSSQVQSLSTCVPNGDFESGATGWTASGTAFNNWPHTNCNNAGACLGTRGLSTYNNGESATGTLTSTAFQISSRYLCWQNGGFRSNYTGLDLDADGSIDLTLSVRGTDGTPASGDNWGEQCFDLGAYIGRTARVVLVDNDTGSTFAWASWDSFSCRDAATPPPPPPPPPGSCVPNGDFQSGATGWTATGTAFNGWPHTNCNNAGACFNGYGLSTLNNSEPATGTLTSSTFTITSRYLCWQNGGFRSSYTGLDLDANGSIDLSLAVRGVDGNPSSGNGWAEQCMDLNAYLGRTARVVLVDDDASSGFAWAAWDSFSCRDTSSPPPPTSCVPNGNFQAGATGWTATGTAFNGWPHTNCNNAGACFNGYGLSTLNNGETATGTLTSSTFTIPSRYLCWQNGGFRSSYTGLDVDANGSVDLVLSARGTDGTGPSGDNWGEQCFDLNAYVGRTVRVVLVDDDTGTGYAWSAWDEFSCR